MINIVLLLGIKPEDVNEVYMGNVCTASEGQAPCRQATFGAGNYQNHEYSETCQNQPPFRCTCVFVIGRCSVYTGYMYSLFVLLYFFF